MKSARQLRRAEIANKRKVLLTQIKSLRLSPYVITAPQILCLERNTGPTRRFFSAIRHLDIEAPKGRQVVVELASVVKISLGAALVLVAEFDRWQRLKTVRLQPITLANWNPEVVQKLVGLGFFRLLKTAVPPAMRTSSGGSWIQFASDTLTIGKAAKLLRRRLESLLGRESGLSAAIYVPLVEAMKNAFQHAYQVGISPNEELKTIGRRWWMAGAVHSAINVLEIAFLDLGITIPGSIPHSNLGALLEKFLVGSTDDAYIVEAMSYGRSRLAEEHRGKGFANIRQPVMLDPRNFVSIISRRGDCLVNSQSVIGRDRPIPLEGTLIRWYLRIPTEPMAGDQDVGN